MQTDAVLSDIIGYHQGMKEGDTMGDDGMIMQAIAYIEDNLEEKLSLDGVARRVGYSKFHLNRMFSERVGCTVYKYIQTRRLTMAAEKLVHSAKPIIEIAYDAGYDAQQSFTLAFRQLYGVTPQRYRRNGVYTPKLGRFAIRSRLVRDGRRAASRGGRAA